MKRVLMFTGAAAVLFAASFAGMLALQGRLNRAGLQGIPLLGGWLAPAQQEPAAPPTTDTPPPAPGPLGAEPLLPYRVGDPVLTGSDTNTAGSETVPPAPSVEPAPSSEVGTQPGEDAEFDRRKEAIYGQGRYERGRLFEFPRIPANLSVDGINRILARAREEMARAQSEREEIKKRQSDLDARERDILDRQETVMREIQRVEQMRTQLEQQIKEAQGLVLLIRQGEVQRYKETARTLANLPAEKAAQVLLDWWRTEAGQEQALKTLELMLPDARDALLDALDVSQLRAVIDRRLRVMQEPPRTGAERR